MPTLLLSKSESIILRTHSIPKLIKEIFFNRFTLCFTVSLNCCLVISRTFFRYFLYIFAWLFDREHTEHIDHVQELGCILEAHRFVDEKELLGLVRGSTMDIMLGLQQYRNCLVDIPLQFLVC